MRLDRIPHLHGPAASPRCPGAATPPALGETPRGIGIPTGRGSRIGQTLSWAKTRLGPLDLLPGQPAAWQTDSGRPPTRRVPRLAETGDPSRDTHAGLGEVEPEELVPDAPTKPATESSHRTSSLSLTVLTRNPKHRGAPGRPPSPPGPINATRTDSAVRTAERHR